MPFLVRINYSVRLDCYIFILFEKGEEDQLSKRDESEARHTLPCFSELFSATHPVLSPFPPRLLLVQLVFQAMGAAGR